MAKVASKAMGGIVDLACAQVTIEWVRVFVDTGGLWVGIVGISPKSIERLMPGSDLEFKINVR